MTYENQRTKYSQTGLSHSGPVHILPRKFENKHLLLLLFILETSAASDFPVLVTQQYGILGHEAKLRCSFDPLYVNARLILWRRSSQYDVVFQSVRGTSDYDILGGVFKNRSVFGVFNRTAGFHDLKIEHTTISDAINYTCEVHGTSKHNKGDQTNVYGKGKKHLILIAPPRKHSQMLNEFGEVLAASPTYFGYEISIVKTTEKQWLLLTCQAITIKLDVNITWSHESAIVKRKYHVGNESGIITTYSTLNITFPSNNKEKTVMCIVRCQNYDGKDTELKFRVKILHKPIGETSLRGPFKPNFLRIAFLILLSVILLVILVNVRGRPSGRSHMIQAVPVCCQFQCTLHLQRAEQEPLTVEQELDL